MVSLPAGGAPLGVGATGVSCRPREVLCQGSGAAGSPAPPRDSMPFGLREWTVWRCGPPDLVVSSGPQGRVPTLQVLSAPPPGLGQ